MDDAGSGVAGGRECRLERARPGWAGRAIAYLLFFLSGATGLVYEVAWSRRLVLLLGTTTRAVSLILAAYMLGLALGAGLAGRRADRLKRPLMVYGFLECAVGAAAYLFPFLLRAAAFFGGDSETLTYVTSFLVLLVPTTLMGATLPVLSRHVVDRLEKMGSRIGLLYGLNTAGAVVGSFLSGFFLVRLLGVYGSTFAAGAVSAAIGIGAVSLGVRRSREVVPLPDRDSGREERGRGLGKLRADGAVALAFMSGFVALGSEVLWTRMLVFFLEGFTYTFSAMLTTFLSGLAVGTVVSGFLVGRSRNLGRYAGWAFLSAALVSSAVLVELSHHFAITKWADRVTAGVPGSWHVHYAAGLFLAAFVVLFPPAVLMGAVFPAVARMATRRISEVGRRIGAVYGANTAGSVTGSLVAGLVLVPSIGMATGAAVVALAGAATGVIALGFRRALFSVPLLGATVFLVLFARPEKPFILHSHVFQTNQRLERKLQSYDEGAYAAVSVVDDVRNDVRELYTDEFEAAATGPHYKYMRMLAHLPLLLAKRWKGARVLVICFGTGTTAGSASVHPLGRLDIVEISPEVLAQAHFFESVNKGILDPTKKHPFPVDLHVDDGRNFLLHSQKKWDVITLEPLMPYTPGAVNLYTRDFYQLCRRHLTKGGVMCQWVPIHAMSTSDYRMLLESFVDVFPSSSLWFVEETSLIVGRTTSGPFDYARLIDRMRDPGVLEDLAEVKFDDPLLVLNTYVTGGKQLQKDLAGAAVMTDEHPTIEFHPAPYGWPNSYASDNLATIHEMRRPVSGVLSFRGLDSGAVATVKSRLARDYEEGQKFIEAQFLNARAAYYDAIHDHKAQSEYFRMSLTAYRKAVQLNPADASARYLEKNALYGWTLSVGMLQLEDERYADAADTFRKAAALDNQFKPDLAYTYLGTTLNRMGAPVAALSALEKALEHFPRSPTALAERGYARYQLKDLRGAWEDFRQAFSMGVAPRAGDDLLAARTRVENMAEKGLLPPAAPVEKQAAALLSVLFADGSGERGASMDRLVALYAVDRKAVRRALAPRLAPAKADDGDPTQQATIVDVLVRLEDVPDLTDLLRTGADPVRERVASRLCEVRQKPVVLALIAAMGDDPDAAVRESAWTSLFSLTGKKGKGYDPDGAPDARRAAVGELRRWWRDAEGGFRFGR